MTAQRCTIKDAILASSCSTIGCGSGDKKKNMSALPHEKRSTHLLLSSRFRYHDRRMFFGRMQLFQDRIEVFGLHWSGIHRRTIPLSEVEQVEWWTGS